MSNESTKNPLTTDLEIEQYLRDLGLTWITIAEAMSDENYEKTKQTLQSNSQITKIEFLTKLQIEEFQYPSRR